MDKCIAIIKTGPRKGQNCGAIKKVIDIVDGKQIPHCNRHKIKEINNNIVDELSEKLNKCLNIEENIEFNNYDGQKFLNKIDKQLDNLFNEYGL